MIKKRFISMLVLLAAVATGAMAQETYKVSVKEGTEDATSWTIAPAEATTTGVAAGTTVTATYSGAKKVKSVKAVKKAKPAATVTTAPTAKTGVKAGQNEAIVNEGAAEGGTMMYMVNATQPASTDGFSATVPTAEGLTAGTYYVWYYVKADASHTDSEISATGIEVTIAAASLIVNPAVGQVIGDDGKNYADAAAATSAGATAVAVIAYVGSETGDDTYKNGLAIALADEFSGMRNWSTAKSTCEGKTAITGAKWCLPSQDQWKQMFKANGGNDARYTGLNTTITTAGGTTLQESNGYWSSSEYQKGANAYYVNLDYDFAGWGYDSESYGSWRVRACLAF